MITAPKIGNKVKSVVLPEDAEVKLKHFYDLIDDDNSGQVETRELVRVCQENSDITGFFGLGSKPSAKEVKEFFRDVDEDGSKSVTWEELKVWYYKVLRDQLGKKLAHALPSHPTWIGTGGQRQPTKPMRRISNDDLMEASLRGDVGLVRRLIEAGAAVNAPVRPLCEDEYMTLLHVLACKPEVPNGARIMSEIMYCKADVDARSSFGSTPLIFACQHKHIGAVEQLLMHDGDADFVNDDGFSATRWALIPRGMPDDEDMTEELWDRYFDQEWQNTSVELIELLGKWGTNLNTGGTITPIAQAVITDNEVIVHSLIECKANADGLHDAVESGSLAIIRVLVNGEANPYRRTAEGQDAMELALARGDAEITEILRDFTGYLERTNHPHLKALEAIQEKENQRKSSKPSNESKCGRKSIVSEEEPLTSWGRLQKTSHSISKNKYFTGFMLIVLAVALFLPDLFVVFQSTDVEVLDWFLVGIFSSFFFEWAFQSIGLGRAYVGKFFFWMDLMGMMSVPLDHSVVDGLLMGSIQSEGVDNSVLVRVTRLARLGARAGRFTKLVKLMRFLPGMGGREDTESAAKNVSAKINTLLSSQVACLIIFMFIVLPIFDFFRYPGEDFSMAAWCQMLESMVLTEPDLVTDLIRSLEEFYDGKAVHPYEVGMIFANGTNSTMRLSADAPVRLEKDSMTYSHGDVYMVFNFAGPNIIEAILNCMLITTISVMMMLAALLVSGSVQKIVLSPLEILLSCVQKIASRICSSVNKMGKQMDQKSVGKKSKKEKVAEEGGFKAETAILDKVIAKLLALSDIANKKKDIGGNEDFPVMGDEDKALLRSWTSTMEEPMQEQISNEEYHFDMDGQELAASREVITHLLEDAEVTWEQMDAWETSANQLTEKQRFAVSVGVLLLHERNKDSVGEERIGFLQVFVQEVKEAYKDVRQVPYHNFAHAADVTFTLHRIFEMSGAENFFSVSERFALLVSALCHDVGHDGRTNPFLVETSDELALRYNDTSPLEHMHAAKLFELANMEKCAIFGHLSKPEYREVRHVCIEAILHTDPSKHQGIVNELNMLYEDNRMLFVMATEDFQTNPGVKGAWPSREVTDHLRTPEVKKLLRQFFLHFSDTTNCMKPWNQCRQWTVMAYEEMWNQGDLEKQLNLPLLPVYDREKCNRAQCTLVYMDFYIAPLVISTAAIFAPLAFCEIAMTDNMQKWFSEWVETTKPDEDEKAKMKERIREVKDASKVPVSPQLLI